MRPLETRARAFAVVAGLALVAGACGNSPKAGVNVKEVGVDLVFGAEVDSASDAPVELGGTVGEAAAPPVSAVGGAGEDDFTFRPSPTTTRPPNVTQVPRPDTAEKSRGICDEPSPDAVPRDPVGSSIRKKPAPGQYPFRYTPTDPGPTKQGYAYISPATTATSGSFDYDISNPFTGRVYTFRVVEGDGLFLVKLVLQKQATPVVMSPAVPLRLLDFPVIPGNRGQVTSQSTDPAGGTLFRYVGTPVAVERVVVCDEVAEAFKVDWELTVDRGIDTYTEKGPVHLVLQYGGWAIRDQLVVTGTFATAKGTTTAMRTSPGRID